MGSRTYNELFSNCTTNVRLHVKDIGSAHPWDWQILINGFIAERAYELGAIDTSLPFAELRRLSYIDYRARDADDDPTFEPHPKRHSRDTLSFGSLPAVMAFHFALSP
jgi:hypothetical protein